MASTKASRKAKRDSYGKSLKGSTKVGTDNGSMIAKMKARKTHNSKDAITKGAVKKSDAQAKGVFLKAVPKGTTAKPASYNGRVVGRQLIRWTGKDSLVYFLYICCDQSLSLLCAPELANFCICIHHIELQSQATRN